jgi:hypothetical protein
MLLTAEKKVQLHGRQYLYLSDSGFTFVLARLLL